MLVAVSGQLGGIQLGAWNRWHQRWLNHMVWTSQVWNSSIAGSLFDASIESCWLQQYCKCMLQNSMLADYCNEAIDEALVLNLIEVWLAVYFISMHDRPPAMDMIMPHSGSRRVRSSWLRKNCWLFRFLETLIGSLVPLRPTCDSNFLDDIYIYILITVKIDISYKPPDISIDISNIAMYIHEYIV